MATEIKLIIAFQQNMFGGKKAIVQANITPDGQNDETDLRALCLGAFEGIARPLRKAEFEVETKILVHRPTGDAVLKGLRK